MPSTCASMHKLYYRARMNRLLIFVCYVCAISVNLVQEVKAAGRPRIIFGDDIQIEDAPYQVSISRDDGDSPTMRCGGTIVANNYVLTAGHCVELEPSEIIVRSGSSEWDKNGQIHKVIEIIRHEDYEDDRFGRPNHDIALLKVFPNFTLDGKKEKLIELPEQDEEVTAGDEAYLSGWGIIVDGTEVLPDQLQGSKMEIMNFEKCSEDYKNFGNMTKYSICAIDSYGGGFSDMCQGDSGGPLVVKGKQVGIVSWSGPGCAIEGRPGVYAKVSKYRNWIDQHIQA